jgi:predicted GNAT family acetyltransferase
MNENDIERGDITVSDAPSRSRFEIAVAGRPVGFVQYRSEPGRTVFTHTEIDDAYGGQGLAGRLSRAALDTARERGQQVTPLCEYMAGFIRRNPAYADLLATSP